LKGNKTFYKESKTQKRNQKKKGKNTNTKSKEDQYVMFFRSREKRRIKKGSLHMTVLLLTRGKEVIVEWLLGQLVWVVAAVVV
jgi:hypothetical protein